MSRRALAVLAAACGAFGMQSLPAAVAAKGGASSTLTATGDGAASATRKAERAAAKAEAVSPPAPVTEAPVPPPAHVRHAPAESSAEPGVPNTALGSRREERGGSTGRGRRRTTQTQQAASATGSGVGTAPASLEAVGGEAEALARKQKKGAGGGEKGSKKERKDKEKGKGKKGTTTPEEEGSGAQGSGAEGEGGSGVSVKSKADLAAGDPAQAAAVAALSLPAATPTSGTGTASISAQPPTAAKVGLDGSAGAHGASKARHQHKRATHAAAAAVTATPLGLSAARTPVVGGATHGASSRPAKRASHKPSSQPALVKTLTKIVGVVPTPVWILIGALIVLALLLATRSLLSGARTRRLLRQRGQLLEDVGLLQAALLPVPPARLGPVATSVAYRPADGPGAGGDFYDVFALADGEIAVIVGDVSGHGREALPHTALLRFTVRAYLEAGLTPRRALQTAGEVLERQLAGSFATVLAATYNPRERKLTYASAGHPPPLVLGENGSTVEAATVCSAPPIGVGIRTGTRQTVVSVPGPARLCFHTDGVTEARVAGELFGSERLAATLAELEPDAEAAALLREVSARTDARPDDMAACLLRVHDGEGAPVVVLEQLDLGRGLVVPAERVRVTDFLADRGVPAAEAGAILDAACARLERVSSVLLELRRDDEGRTVATLPEDNVIHPPALAIAGAS